MTVLPTLPQQANDQKHWGNITGSHLSFVLSELIQQTQQSICIVVPSMQQLERLAAEMDFFLGDDGPIVHLFPDWETLPYDSFSPHQDIVSERIHILRQLLINQRPMVVITTARCLMNRLAPTQFIAEQCLSCKVGDHFDAQSYRNLLTQSGYHSVNQVMTRGEFAIRGSIIDVFPMGAKQPYRIDLFDDEIDSIRTFDLDTQRSSMQVDAIELLPAHEFPLEKANCEQFIENWQLRFPSNTWQSPILEALKYQRSAGGLEYYLSLFFTETHSLIQYLPSQTLLIEVNHIFEENQQAWQEIQTRYQTNQYDLDRPPLKPEQVFFHPDVLQSLFKAFPQLKVQQQQLTKTHAGRVNFDAVPLPNLAIETNHTDPFKALTNFIAQDTGRVLFVAESPGRREILNEHLQRLHLSAKRFESWHQFVQDDAAIGLCIGSLGASLRLPDINITLIAEQDLFVNKVPQQRRQKRTDAPLNDRVIYQDLSELKIGDAVVHLEHGIGRYEGLITLSAGNQETEFLTLVYAKGDKLYVPIHNLHLISQYSVSELEHTPLNQLGTEQWSKAKAKAAKRIHDVAAELLEIQAQRNAKSGFAYTNPDEQYQQFTAGFPFQETPDQITAIDAVITDMMRPHPMDRLLCGDVGFGKTEVAMRAAFMAVQNGKQVAILVPTTLLAEQHYQNFVDRFADWPVVIDELSRFRSATAQKKTLQKMADGKVDIVIGTHALLNKAIEFKNLGLIIIDEEHRFGVRQKEQLKSLRTEVDVLTMTATPIPRTLNMALADIRDMSIIASPPAKRLAVNTFVKEYRDAIVKEAILREVLRGGQVYFLHNDVKTMAHQYEALSTLLPDIKIAMAHGQMREKELETIMADFYHNRYQILLCSTIIETGIDIPNANTIIINRADKLGLAQLHQLRGRVGRSHHQAYAYLLTPPWKSLSKDAQKRLEAIQAASELGAGYMLASHDLEIRGAGELLGEDQSGQMQTIGYSLYMELLDKTVSAMQHGQAIDADTLLNPKADTEIDLGISTIIPENYLADVSSRLRFYKKIMHAKSERELDDIQIELIDRFGLLPESVKHLFASCLLKFIAKSLGITTIKAHANGGKMEFTEQPQIVPAKLIQLVQKTPQTYQLAGPQTLKWIEDLPEPKQRIAFINKLLTSLQGH